MLKATKVDGVYDSDPKLNPKAKRYDRLTYDKRWPTARRDGPQRDRVVREGGLPIIVFDFFSKGNMRKVRAGREYRDSRGMK